MSNLSGLQTWLLGALRDELVRAHPEVVETFEKAPPQSDQELQDWADRLPFRPPEPWNTLVAAVVSVRLGLAELYFLCDTLKVSLDGRGVHTLQVLAPLAASSCIERLEFVVKRASRGKRPKIEQSLATELLAQLGAARQRPLFEPLRNSAAHGPHLGFGKGGWIESAGRQRLWEMVAMNREDGSEVIDVMLAFNPDRRDRQHQRLRPFVDAISALMEDVARRMLEALKHSEE